MLARNSSLHKRWRLTIQLPYCNTFPSIWEYDLAFRNDEINFAGIVGLVCPICGERDCFREIHPYSRTVIDLLPYREGRVWVVRFQCNTTGLTFSLLPIQLIPYCRYTANSILFALLLAHASGQSLFSVAEKELEPDCRVSGWLMRVWLPMVLLSLCASHFQLRRWYAVPDPVGPNPGDVRSRLGELHVFCTALGIGARAPPDVDGLSLLLNRFSRATGLFMFGIPSQERGGRCAR